MAIMLLWISTMLTHPVRASISEISVNPAEHRLEVSIRFAVDDETWIVGQDGDREPFDHVRALKYLVQHYQVSGGDYQWVGRSRDGGHAWWHFTIKPKDIDDLVESKMTVTLLSDRRDRFHPDNQFHHRITVLDGSSRRGYDFHRRRRTQTLRMKTELSKAETIHE